MNKPESLAAGDALAGSRALHARASKVFPDGVGAHSQLRAPHPLYLARAEGARLYDVDGHAYVDYMLGAGPAILGHRHPAIVEAVERALATGLPNIAVTEAQIELAETVQRHVPSMQRLRFLPTGTEAVQAAIRVARRATGRRLVAKFEGAYHGQADNVMVSVAVPAEQCGSLDAPQAVPYHCALPEEIRNLTLVLPYNDLARTGAILERHAQDVAIVLIEPMLGFAGAIPAEREFLHGLRALTAQHGIVLAFDEVITGFRLGLGGGQGYYGVTPDLTILGKAIGGGMPLAAFGGRAELMDWLSQDKHPHDYVFQSGTYSALPLSLAAGLATLRVLEQDGGAAELVALGEYARAGLRRVLDAHAVEAVVTGIGSLFHLHFGLRAVHSARDAEAADADRVRRLHQALLAHGLYFYAGRLGFLSTAHTHADIDALLAAVEIEVRRG
ncbi:MAG TPA: aspartate aminotransferase family protein [Gammaproteobacteria bacterium]|nr:aspartate aminotransferase family protein [Gammaproteobacteria bacterium]